MLCLLFLFADFMGPEARRSAVEKLLARAEDQHAKSRRTGSGQGPAPKHLDRNVPNYLRQKVLN